MAATVTYRPTYAVTYNGKNITEDVTRFLLSLTYTDRVGEKSDEVELRFDDADGRWRTTWAPAKKDKITVEIGDGTVSVNCGTFEVDEIEYEGPPDTLVLRAIATGTSKAVRTKKSSAHEKKTLKQIAQAVADANGLTLQGTIENITIARATQHRETDLAFLHRLADEYGHVFSVRDGVMTFHSVFELEGAAAASVIEYSDLVRYSVRVKTVGTYKETKVASRNPGKNEVVSTSYKGNTQDNADGIPFAQVVAEDTQVIHNKTEDAGQADRKAKAAHHKANSKEVTGDFEAPGRPLLLAGTNHAIHGLGMFSGVFHITESRHTISRNNYTTSFQAKKVNTVAADNQARQSVQPLPRAEISKQ